MSCTVKDEIIPEGYTLVDRASLSALEQLAREVDEANALPGTMLAHWKDLARKGLGR